MKLNVSMDCCDEIVVASLKKDIKTVRSMIKISKNPIDISNNKKVLKAIKCVLEYYGG